MKDLIVLVADLDTENVLQGFFPRLEHVCGTCPFSYDIFRHQERDNGCAQKSIDFLRSFHNKYHYALVIFDKEGSGKESLETAALEAGIEAGLASNGWAAENVAVIAIDPEVENWIWVNSPNMSRELNWTSPEALYAWLSANGWRAVDAAKPAPPKEALEAVLKKTKKPRSAMAIA